MLFSTTPPPLKMKRTSILSTISSFLLVTAGTGLGQSGPAATTVGSPSITPMYSTQGTAAPGSGPVSYASMSQLNGMLEALEATSKTMQGDLVKLRIEHWKTDTASKKQALSNVDSIQRNLQGALPSILAQLRTTPEDVPATFKLYRNLDALYDVLGSVVEGTGAFGSKDDLQALSNDLNSFEGTRKQIAERIESLAAGKEAEIVRLRSDLKTAQAAIPATPPPKIVVDDNAPAKKPAVKKKAPAKPATTPAPTTTKPAAGQTAPPATQAPAAKPQ
jgi:hypothetical protein